MIRYITLLTVMLLLTLSCSDKPTNNIFDKTTGKTPSTEGKTESGARAKPALTQSGTATANGSQQQSTPEPKGTQASTSVTKNTPSIKAQQPKSKQVKPSKTEQQFIHIKDCQGSGGQIVDSLYIARFCSIDDALGFIEDNGVKGPVLVIDAGRYSVRKTIDRGVEFRASDELAPSERVVITPPFLDSGHDCCTLRVIMQKSDDELVLDGLHITARAGLPTLSVTSGKISASDTTFSDSIVLQGKASVGELIDVSVSGPIHTEDYKPEDTTRVLGIPTLGQCRNGGIAVLAGAVLEASRVTISDASPLGICVSDTNSTATLIDSSIVDTIGLEYMNHWVGFGWGGFVGNGGELRLVGSTVNNTWVAGLVVDGVGSHLTLSDGSTLSDTGIYGAYLQAAGILAQNLGEVTLLDSEITRIASGVGLLVSSDGIASVTDVVFDENGTAGVAVINGTLRMIRGKVVNTTGGVGVLVQSDLEGVSDVFIEDSTIARNSYTGFWLNGGGGSTTIVGATFRDNAVGIEETTGWITGHGIHVECYGINYWESCPVQRVSATDLVLTQNRFSRTSPQGSNLLTDKPKLVSGGPYVHVFLDGSNATLTGNSYVGGTVDVHQQKCSHTTPVDLSKDGAIRNNLCPQWDNQSRSVWFSFIFEDGAIAP